VGIVSEFDFLRVFTFTSNQILPHYDELMSRRVAAVMTEPVVHVDPTAPLTRVLQLMASVKARSFPVLNVARHLEGVISREDIMPASVVCLTLMTTTRESGLITNALLYPAPGSRASAQGAPEALHCGACQLFGRLVVWLHGHTIRN
jgi:hypothetical protein